MECTAFALPCLLNWHPSIPTCGRPRPGWWPIGRACVGIAPDRVGPCDLRPVWLRETGKGELDPDFTLIARVGGGNAPPEGAAPEFYLMCPGRRLVAGGDRSPGVEGRRRVGAGAAGDTARSTPACPSTPGPRTRINRSHRALAFRGTRVPEAGAGAQLLGGQILSCARSFSQCGSRVESGDRIRVRSKLKAHRDLEYLEIHDPRPAGCEPVEQLSGWMRVQSLSGRRGGVRDEENTFFISGHDPGGRARGPLRSAGGDPRGLPGTPPALVGGMYLPDVNGTLRTFALEIE